MASLFFAGEKAPKQEAINALVLMIANHYDGRYEVFATADDGGNLIEVQVEVLDVSKDLDSQAPNFPFFEIWPIWMGWRAVIVKVPPGYIDSITNREDAADY